MSENVLFLVVDSLRYDAVAGDEFDTPNLDALAEDGVSFSRCFAQGISTAPSMTAILTGRYPLDYGGHWYLEEDQPTMAEQFQRNGYTTGAIHSNPNVSRLRNFDRGFDTFEENILPYDPDGLVDNAPDSLLRYANKAARILRRTPYLPAEKVNLSLAEWIGSTDDPWFLWTQYMDVHGPYLPGGDFGYRNKFRAERLWRKAAVNAPDEITPEEHDELWTNYGKEVEYLDREIGNFLDTLEERNELEETAVVVVGDHGDEFDEHGLYGHKNLPYDELTRVPLLIRFPDAAPTDQLETVDTVVRTIDILPTLLDLADADYSNEMADRLEGESLLPVIEGETPGYDVVLTEKEVRGEDYLRLGFRTDRWKYLYDGKTDEQHLYDLSDDPGETNDVTDQHPEIVEQFRERLNDRFEKIEETSEGVDVPDIDDHKGVEERLKALGYK
ncbi:sulfatase [Halorubrum ezzemoulense]|uniref:Sulfatase n=1 Tax=Halorubrum ezzemoulense TaxID=337243 RepID=A0ABT4Z477_HALEZ|nr:sulfatase [Halorubrum ezzemoulense]MDB2245708.1 sulfatase [Halorubrum ezzemoulense]MDB2279355.1 sulfatase [Halorubrum ezzemoulense]MDB2289875.1 sulfatase [Halorubrum ezzemoulense]MDB2292959.1 sulfatase [Halorubrum ezzemoulense]MDB2297345.1 sulfatase [Halorubrum ezzemoulense]